ncbi:MAG: hypothetical protein WC130_12595 [Kiritimatiellia bacterium]
MEDGISLSLSHPGMRRAFEDVDIRPGPDKKYLTIPACAEAYNKRAYRFDNLEVLFGKNGPYALAERKHTEIRWRTKRFKIAGHGDEGDVTSSYKYAAAGEQRGGRIFYYLVKSVHQPRDPSLLPDDNAIVAAAISGARDFINLLINSSASAV